MNKLKHELADPLDIKILDWLIYMASYKIILWLHVPPCLSNSRAATAVLFLDRLADRFDVNCSVVFRHPGCNSEETHDFAFPVRVEVSSRLSGHREGIVPVLKLKTGRRELLILELYPGVRVVRSAPPSEIVGPLGFAVDIIFLRREGQLRVESRQNSPPIYHLWVADFMQSLSWSPLSFTPLERPLRAYQLVRESSN